MTHTHTHTWQNVHVHMHFLSFVLIFSLPHSTGKVVFCEIQTSKDGKSRGMGTVQYEKSSDALNAIG